MAEANEAEPNERAAPSPRRPRRNHVINLCCAQSVHKVVEEVARSLEGLGFPVTVVCGAEARAALLGSRTDSNQPTIHVVCVQGSMQERVLKPLRQALATHGGPNHHLFVAVLDLGVPLAMVGQIRRFAEALERPAPPLGGDEQGGREPSLRIELEQAPTRAYPSVAQVPERPGTKPPLSPSGDEASRRSRPLTSRGRAAKVAPTAKYQAVTASHAVVPPVESGVRKRRRERSRLSPSSRRPGRAPAARVLGLPEHDMTRDDSGPLPRREPPPPPPPPAGETAKRRSSTTVPAVASVPPPPSTPLRSSASASHEPDRLVPRADPGFRFTPPGVKSAEVRRTQSGPYTSVPLADVLSDADRTVVQGRLEEVPRTASTLRLDEPPFKDGPTPRSPRAGQDEDDAEVLEPTMIIAAPTSPTADTPVEPLEPAERTRIEAPPSRPAQAEVSETDKTLLRGDGTFESAPTVLRKAEEAARQARTQEPRAGDGSAERRVERATDVRPVIALEPEDRSDAELDFTPKKTLLYADSVRAPLPAPDAAPADAGRTMVASAPAGPASDAPPPASPTPQARSADDVALEAPSPIEGKATSSRRRAPPSAIPTERHALPPAATGQQPSRRRPKARPAPAPTPTASPTPTRAHPKAASSSYGWLWILLVLLTAGGGWGAFQAGLFDGVLGRDHSRGTTIADASPPEPGGAETKGTAPTAPGDAGEAGDTPTPAAEATTDEPPAEPNDSARATTNDAEPTDDPTGPGTTGDPEPDDDGTTRDPEPDDPDPTQGTAPEPVADPTPPVDDPEPIGDPPEPPVTGPAPTLTAEEQLLTAAVDDRRIFMLKTLFTTRRQGTATTFAGGWQRCATLEIDGVKGWRLPHRREMKLVNAVLALPSGIYWTRTVPNDDKQAAYVLDSSSGALSLFLKHEPTGEVVCVRRREHPDR